MDTLLAHEKLNQRDQDAFVKKHLPMVKRIAHYLLGRLPHVVQSDDLIQAGMLGLLEALSHYDATKGAAFETYASIRIRGHMLDEVRRNNWVPRSVYRNSRILTEAAKKVENTLGREAKDYEIAAELNLELEDYFELVKDSSGNLQYGFDDLGVTDDLLQSDLGVESNEPHVNVLRDDMANQLSEIIEKLPKKEQIVLLLYYKQDLNLKEIGDVLDVSESRVCQIHSQAMRHLKKTLSIHDSNE